MALAELPQRKRSLENAFISCYALIRKESCSVDILKGKLLERVGRKAVSLKPPVAEELAVWLP